MNKKEYIKLSVKAIKLDSVTTILAGSVPDPDPKEVKIYEEEVDTEEYEEEQW